MKLLAFCLLLGMRAQAQDDPCQFAKLHDGALVDEAPRCVLLNQLFIHATALDDIIRAEFAEAAQRAADETDGKPQLWIWPDGKILWIDPKVEPHKPWDEVDGMDWPRKFVPAESVDVPAVQVGGHLGFDGCGQSACFDHWVTDYTCTDKSRVLLTSEDGKKHCVKF